MTYRKIDTSMWSDSAFVELSGEAKYAYVYLLTSPHGKLTGCFECSAGLLSRDTGLILEAAKKAIEEIEAKGLISMDRETNEVLIRKFGQHQWAKSDRVLTALKREMDKIASANLKAELEQIFDAFVGRPYRYDGKRVSIASMDDTDTVSIPSAYDTDTVPIPYAYDTDMVSSEFSTKESAGQISYPYGIDTISDTDTELDSDSCELNNSPIPQQPERARASDDPSPSTPTIEEIRAYAKRLGIVVDCDAFFELNEGKGWVVDGKPVRNWQGLLKGWAEAERRRQRDVRKAAEVHPLKHGKPRSPYMTCPKCDGPIALNMSGKKECVTCGNVIDAEREAVTS